MWKPYNPNPVQLRGGVGDCAVRAIAKALDITWEQAYTKLAANGFLMGEMMNSDLVIGSVLRQNGFVREIVPNTCPDCYTVDDFCNDHPYGTYVVKTENHVAAIIDGALYDSWNSSTNAVLYFWKKGNGE